MLARFDQREVGYRRIRLSLEHLRPWVPRRARAEQEEAPCVKAEAEVETEAEALSEHEAAQHTAAEHTAARGEGPSADKEASQSQNLLPSISDRDRIWTYVPLASHSRPPNNDFPICQTYVDVCVEGCLQHGGPSAASPRCVAPRSKWSRFT